MDSFDGEGLHVRNALLCASGIAWAALLFCPGSSTHCELMASGTVSWQEALEVSATRSAVLCIKIGWLLMIVAMMAPTLILPIEHVRVQSLRRRRVRSVILFLTGFSGIWLIAGVVTMFYLTLIGSLITRTYAMVGGVVIALIWQSSPIKQRCLNSIHRHPPMAAFGYKADRATFRFGLIHGVACFGSCWALMLLPMLLRRGQMIAMLVASLLIFSERIDPFALPCWRWRISDKLLRISVTQLRIRLRSLQVHQSKSSLV